MRRLASMVVVVGAVLLSPARAHATCTTECQLTPMLESCEVPASVDCPECNSGQIYTWDVLERVTFFAECQEQCCVAPECSPWGPTEPDPTLFRLFDQDTEELVEVTTTIRAETCDGLVVMDAALVEGHRYQVTTEGLLGFELEVASAEEQGGCRHGGSLGPWSLGLLLVGLRLSARARARRRA